MYNKSSYKNFTAPFSGDVTQTINPWSWWNQYGLVNINVMASSDPTLEKRIVENVASYGKQLGRIVDLLSTFRRHLPAKGWNISEEDKKVIEDFDDLARAISAAKAGYAAPTRESIESFISGLKYLKRQDANAYKQVIQKLERELIGKSD